MTDTEKLAFIAVVLFLATTLIIAFGTSRLMDKMDSVERACIHATSE